VSAAPFLIEARDLRVEHRPGGRRGAVRALDGVTLGVRPGEVVAVVGESGAGKSTLVRALLALEPAARGSVLWREDGAREPLDLLRLPPRALRRLRARLQVVFQDPLASLDPRWSARAVLREALGAHRAVAPAEGAARALALLERVGLAREHLDRRPHELSGGERQRLCLARALAVEPRFLALDEPVAALDASVQAQVLELLADLRRERGLAYLLVTHDLSVAAWLADRVAVLDGGRIVEEGPVEQVLRAPAHARTRELVAARAALEGG
jgi:peptide/nickel transport system ATP-binding protein